MLEKNKLAWQAKTNQWIQQQDTVCQEHNFEFVYDTCIKVAANFDIIVDMTKIWYKVLIFVYSNSKLSTKMIQNFDTFVISKFDGAPLTN